MSSATLGELALRLEEAEAREREIREAPETVEQVRRELAEASRAVEEEHAKNRRE